MSFQLFDRLAAFFRQANLYRKDNLFIDQTSLDRITAGGEFLNFGHQNSLLEQTNLQINRLERYKDFDQMDEVGEITMALDLYADEASLIDPELKHAIAIKAASKRVKEELERFFYDTILIDHHLRPMIRYLVKYGDFASEIIPNKNRNGVMSIRFMNVYNFTRVETRYGDLVGFFFQDQLVSQPMFLHPWQVMHLRLTSYENIYHPYGRSILDGARKHFKQLRLMEDAALIYRITRAPEKRVFTIPVGNIPTHEVPQYIELIARQFKKKRFFDPSTGDVNERWHPLIQEDDFWLPQRQDGNGPTVTTLPGAENLDDIKDIEYFKKKMVSALKIPFARVGIGEGAEGNDKSLSQVSPDFAKAIQHVQREVAIGLKKIAIVHLALRGYTEEDMRDFDIHLTSASAIDELYRIETWASRANVIAQLNETGLFPKRWLLEHFTSLTDDEIKQMEKEVEEMREKEMGMGMGMGMGGGMPMGGMPPPPGGDLPPMPEPGELAPLDAGAPPPGPPVPEGYDSGLEERLITEMNRPSLIVPDTTQIYVNRGLWKGSISEEFNSGFDHLMNSSELDGLTGTDNNVLVESVNDEERASAKNEMFNLLNYGSEEVDDENEEITERDLPG